MCLFLLPDFVIMTTTSTTHTLSLTHTHALSTVLKFADSVLKGYATAISVVLTGVFSMIIFGTELDFMFFVGVLGVISAVWLYNAKELKFF